LKIVLVDPTRRSFLARLLPTGECWCGCGSEVGLGSFFAQGHDKRAEGLLIKLHYGSVAGFLSEHGYQQPGGKNLMRESGKEPGDG
jgi:hypothetical protein